MTRSRLISNRFYTALRNFILLAPILIVLSNLVLARLLDSESSSESSDRAVAEWVLRLGGSIILEGDPRAFWDVAELPPGDIRLQVVNLVGTLVDPSRLELLSSLV